MFHVEIKLKYVTILEGYGTYRLRRGDKVITGKGDDGSVETVLLYNSCSPALPILNNSSDCSQLTSLRGILLFHVIHLLRLL